MDHAEAFLVDQIPLPLQAMIPTTLKTAYQAAAVLIAEAPILRVPSARDNHGRIKQWAVDMEFEKLVESGKWPFDFRWRHFEKPTGRYLEIIPSHSVITISQVQDPKKQPRDVVFRQNKRLNTQPWLANLPDPSESLRTSGLPHILLVHGYQNLTFAHLGIPNEDHRLGYAHRSRNLMGMAHEAPSSSAPPVEETDIDAVMTLKEEIDRWRRDNGGA